MNKIGFITVLCLFTLSLAQTNPLLLPDLIIYNPDSLWVQPSQPINFLENSPILLRTSILPTRTHIYLPPARKLDIIPPMGQVIPTRFIQELEVGGGYNRWFWSHYRNHLALDPLQNQIYLNFETYRPIKKIANQYHSLSMQDKFITRVKPSQFFSCPFSLELKRVPAIVTDSFEQQISSDAYAYKERWFDYLNWQIIPEYEWEWNSHPHSMSIDYRYQKNSITNRYSEDANYQHIKGSHHTRFEFQKQVLQWTTDLAWRQTKTIQHGNSKEKQQFLHFSTRLATTISPLTLEIAPGYASDSLDRDILFDFKGSWQIILKDQNSLSWEFGSDHRTNLSRLETRQRMPGPWSASNLGFSPHLFRQTYTQFNALYTPRPSIQLESRLGYSLLSDVWNGYYDPEQTVFSPYFVDYHQIQAQLQINWNPVAELKIQSIWQFNQYRQIESDTILLFYQAIPENYTRSSAVKQLFLQPKWQWEGLIQWNPQPDWNLLWYIYYVGREEIMPGLRVISYMSWNWELRKNLFRELSLIVTAQNILNQKNYLLYPYRAGEIRLGMGLLWQP